VTALFCTNDIHVYTTVRVKEVSDAPEPLHSSVSLI
jgi:hypothetical protein